MLSPLFSSKPIFRLNSLNNSFESNIAAKEPFTILGDIGELAKRSEVPKLLFRFFVSPSGTFLGINIGIGSVLASSSESIMVAVSFISCQSLQISSTVVCGDVTVNRIT